MRVRGDSDWESARKQRRHYYCRCCCWRRDAWRHVSLRFEGFRKRKRTSESLRCQKLMRRQRSSPAAAAGMVRRLPRQLLCSSWMTWLFEFVWFEQNLMEVKERNGGGVYILVKELEKIIFERNIVLIMYSVGREGFWWI